LPCDPRQLAWKVFHLVFFSIFVNNRVFQSCLFFSTSPLPFSTNTALRLDIPPGEPSRAVSRKVRRKGRGTEKRDGGRGSRAGPGRGGFQAPWAVSSVPRGGLSTPPGSTILAAECRNAPHPPSSGAKVRPRPASQISRKKISPTEFFNGNPARWRGRAVFRIRPAVA
jgi:hypothetical protein